MAAAQQAYNAWTAAGCGPYDCTLCPPPPPASLPAAPRASDGHLSLSGVWTNATVTSLTRPPGVKLVVSKAEADEIVAKLVPVVRQFLAEGGAP